MKRHFVWYEPSKDEIRTSMYAWRSTKKTTDIIELIVAARGGVWLGWL